MGSLQKIGRIRLPPAKYKLLCQEVLERDGWACKRCSRRTHLQVHHIIKRSYCRIDASWNLCTLCEPCHTLVERHVVDAVGNADLPATDSSGLRFRLRSSDGSGE